MKKEGIIAIVLLTVVFSSLFVSASIFTDFWGRMTGRAMDTPPKGIIPAPNDPVEINLGCTVDVDECGGDYPNELMSGSVYINITNNVRYCLLSAYPELDEDYLSWPFEGTCAEVKEVQDGFCYDSDFGNSAYVAGTTSSSSRDFFKETKQDKCEDTKILREYYCVPYNVENCRMPTGCIRSELITCPDKCEKGACVKTTTPDTTKKTCAELQGKVCEEGYECKEDFADASDEDKCCTAECEKIPSNLEQTCAELQGKVCEEGYECKEDFADASDEDKCCTAECEKITEDKCPFSNRQSGKYCAADGKYYPQLEDEAKCENNFECHSNLCISGKCVSSSFMERVLEWFRRLFGVKVPSNLEQTCAELQGKVCEEGYECKEDFADASDEDKCCTAECEKIPSNLEQTCAELQGKVCEEGYECKEDFADASDEDKCCTAECEKIEVLPAISGTISCFPIDSTKIKIEYSYDLNEPNPEVSLFNENTKVTLLPERKNMVEKTDSDGIKFYQYNVSSSVSSKYYNSYEVPSCPNGWTNYKNWLTSKSVKCPNWISFCQKCDTGNQSWGDHKKSSCTRPQAGLCNAVTCYSEVVQLGCVPSGKGVYVHRGLKPSTEYTYYLRDGTSANSPLIAEAVTCKTKETYEEETPKKVIQCTENSNCAKDEYCDSDNQCVTCSCGDKECGHDQCGNQCGKDSDNNGILEGCTPNEICNIFGQCVECSYDSDCSGSEGKRCKEGKCVECITNSDCEIELGYRCASGNTCTNGCTADNWCPSGFKCEQEQCVKL